MGYCYRYVTVETKGGRAETYALLDNSSPLNAMSDEFARQVKAQHEGSLKVRGPNGEAIGWRARTPVSFNRTDVKLPEIEFVVVSKRVIEDDIILGHAAVEAVGREKLLSIRYKCDRCREPLDSCEHSRRKVDPILG